MAKGSKIIYDGKVLIDLTGDTVTEDKVLKGYTTHGPDGEPMTGTCEYDANTSDITPGKAASESEILYEREAWANGVKKVGTMPNKGGVTGTISAKDDTYTIPKGYHDGSGTVSIADTEKERIIPENIREGVTLLGVEGTMSGTEDAVPQARTVTPTSSQQVVTPQEGYNYLSQVTVEAIPYTESVNSAGGLTITIG